MNIAYGRIERGVTDISISRIEQIAIVLESEIETLFNFNERNIVNNQHNNGSIFTSVNTIDKELFEIIKN